MGPIRAGFLRTPVAATFYLLGLAVFCSCAALPLEAAEPSSRNLDSGWQFRAVANTDRSDVKQWHPAQIPGVVQTDLLHGGLIPDPFDRDNEFRLQWIGLADWEYQTTFQIDAAALAHDHVDLVFDGLDTFADVYLNDQAVLHADNMFRRWRVPSKALLRSGPNTLRVVFHSAVEKMLPYVKSLPYVLPSISTHNYGNEENIATAPYTRKAPYNYGWDWGPRFLTEGIWQPVHLETWDVLRIENFHIHQQSITADMANVTAELEIEASRPTTATLTLTHDELSGPQTADGTQTLQLNAGINHLSFPLRIAAPKLWYPVGYGSQNRYRFSASVRVGREVASRSETKTGLRSIQLRRVPDQWGKSFEFVVNGISVFAKGADVIPFDSFPNRVTPENHRNILQSARDAHMNMVREWGGGYYESDDFYDICDELGIMVWQEFMFGGDMVPGDTAFQENVRQEAIDQIKRLRDHPSIVIWCGNNEVETGWLHWGDRQEFKESISAQARERVWQDYVILFADILKSAVAQYADPVPYTPSSPSANFEEPPDNPQNGDMHYWQVWHAQAPASDYTLQFPRFMSEFGFQSFPEMRTIRAFAKPEDFNIHSTVMQAHQKNKGGNERILTYMLREYREPRDFASFVYLSQVQQAEIIKIGAEHLRRQRPRTMGSLYWQLNDCWPVASWASIDYYGRWKALHYYARRFYDDVLISPFLHDDQVDVYVVSDKLQPLSGTVHMRLLDFSGNVLLDQTKDVQIAAQSSAISFTVDKAALAAKGDLRRSFLVFDLEVAGRKVSRNLTFFDVSHNLELPVSPNIETTLNKTGEDYTITLQSSKLARNVYLSFGDLDVQISDNYFDLLPAEPVTIRLKSSATLEKLRGALKTMSLTEAFNSN
ncbi:MAG TPA: glycoside hydrolase family 2 protein [Candidatus Acidoferrum sp.]|jgi:beta-mannosidase|nr:glycoside hydrolase family 2 protein [Candidatus Acidoferrum sp.]